MNKMIYFLLLSFSLTFCVSAEPVQKNPHTAKVPADGSYNIGDPNDGSPAGKGSFTLMLKNKDYGLSITRLILDLGESAAITGKEISESSFRVVDINKSGKGIQNITGVSVTDSRGYAVESGRYATIDLDFVMDPASVTASFYIVTINKDLGIYKKGTKFIQKGRTVRK